VPIDDIVNVVIEEHKTYPFAAFVSDTGGSAGLFLGLNIIGFTFFVHIIFLQILLRFTANNCEAHTPGKWGCSSVERKHFWQIGSNNLFNIILFFYLSNT